MAIRFHPDVGDILICDFSQLNTKVPEMVKRRPVVCLTPRRRYGQIITIVPLSTTPPTPVQIWHAKLHVDLPHPYDSPEVWVKGDMLYSLSMERLSLFTKGKDRQGKRIYVAPKLSEEQIKKVFLCISKGLVIERYLNDI